MPYACPATASRWRLQEPWLRAVATEATGIVNSPPSTIANGRYLKRERRRLVFSLQTGKTPLLIKAMPLDSLRARLRQGRYAPAEADHLAQAAERGLPVPQVLGLGHQRGLALVRWNAVIMEFLPHVSLRERFLKHPPEDESSLWGLLTRSRRLLTHLYQAGCNHIDFGPHAVMLDPHPEGEDDRVIDFQYCHFHAQPRPETLAAQAGYFAWSISTNRDWVAVPMIEKWFDTLLEECGLTSDEAKLRPLFETARKRRASIRERLHR